MIYITSDTHGLRGIQKVIDFCRKNKVRGEDYLLICGDFYFDGAESETVYRYLGVWPGTVLFIDGNHENFDNLNALPQTLWMGGKVHQINERLLHLMRGQVFEIEGYKIFTMGGNETRGKDRKVDAIEWYPAEKITDEDIEEGRRNLARHDNTVDIIVAHCAPLRVIESLYKETGSAHFAPNESTRKVTALLAPVQYNKWYSGHYHIDRQAGKVTIIFSEVVKLF